MINEPSVEEVTKKIASRYWLCTVCAKRARQIIDQAQSQGLSEPEGKVKPLTMAAREIMSGRVTAAKD